MRVPFYQVDAFATARFKGNPAAVMVMPNFPGDDVLQAIAAENNLAETAFLVGNNGRYRLRWFTPLVEVPLCGHATLASAAVVMQRLEPACSSVVFDTASGFLPVIRSGNGYLMDFPANPPNQSIPASDLNDALGISAIEACRNGSNYLAVLEDPQAVRELRPNMQAIAALDRPGLIVTARDGRDHDFVSRYFAPAKGIPEDPVTGGAHCMLVPYWAEKLRQTEFRAYQASSRGGEIIARLRGDRVDLEGDAIFYLEGYAEI